MSSTLTSADPSAMEGTLGSSALTPMSLAWLTIAPAPRSSARRAKTPLTESTSASLMGIGGPPAPSVFPTVQVEPSGVTVLRGPDS